MDILTKASIEGSVSYPGRLSCGNTSGGIKLLPRADDLIPGFEVPIEFVSKIRFPLNYKSKLIINIT